MALATAGDYSDWATMVGLPTAPDGLADALAWASAEAVRHCGRAFAYAPADAGADETRSFTGNGDPALPIDDLLAVTSVTFDGAALAAGAYYLEAAGAPPYLYIVRATYNWTQGKTLQITGQWGYAATVPADVVEAVCMLAAARLQGAGTWTSGGVKSTSVLGVSVTYAGASEGLDGKRQDALRLLNHYRRCDPEPTI